MRHVSPKCAPRFSRHPQDIPIKLPFGEFFPNSHKSPQRLGMTPPCRISRTRGGGLNRHMSRFLSLLFVFLMQILWKLYKGLLFLVQSARPSVWETSHRFLTVFFLFFFGAASSSPLPEHPPISALRALFLYLLFRLLSERIRTDPLRPRPHRCVGFEAGNSCSHQTHHIESASKKFTF